MLSTTVHSLCFYIAVGESLLFTTLSVSLCSLHHCQWVFALYTTVSESLLFTPLSVSLCSLHHCQRVFALYTTVSESLFSVLYSEWLTFLLCACWHGNAKIKKPCTHHNSVTDWLCRYVLADLPVPARCQCAHQSNTPIGWHILCVPVAMAAQTPE